MVSVKEAENTADLIKPIDSDESLKYFDRDFSNYRRQSFKEYSPNGAIFIGKKSNIYNKNIFWSKYSIYYESDRFDWYRYRIRLWISLYMYEKEEKYMKKVAFATGSRADYGIMREYLRLLNNDENIDLSILVTGALLDDKYGNQVSLIEDDGFYIESKVKVDLNSTSNKNILLSIGEIIKSFAEVLIKISMIC